MKKKYGIMAITAILLIAAVSILYVFTKNQSTSKPNNTVKIEDITRDSILRVGISDDIPSMAAYDPKEDGNILTNQLLYNGLFKFDENNKPVPDLVEEYKNDKNTLWEFKLKEGVKFQDGNILNTSDVKATFGFIKNNPDTAHYLDHISSIDIMDDYHFTITTISPYSNLLYDLCANPLMIMAGKSVDALDTDWYKNGTGPYRYIENEENRFVFEKREDYFDYTDTSHKYLEIIPSLTGEEKVEMIKSFDLDMAFDIPPESTFHINEKGNIKLSEYTTSKSVSIGINNEKEFLSNSNLRGALDSLIDKDAINFAATKYSGNITYSQTPFVYIGSGKNENIFNQAKAIEIISSLHTNLEFELLYLREDLQTAEIIKLAFKAGDVKINLKETDSQTKDELLKNGDYELVLNTVDSRNTIDFVMDYFTENNIGRTNYTRFYNTQIQKLIDEYLSEFDEGRQLELEYKIISMLNTETPQIPLYIPKGYLAYDHSLKHVNPNYFGFVDYHKITR